MKPIIAVCDVGAMGFAALHPSYKGNGPANSDLQRFKAMGNEIAYATPEQFDAMIRAEIPKWAEVARRAGIKPE